MIELNCTGCTKLATLNWMNGKTKLQQFLFENTAISGNEVSKLDTYATALQSFKCNNVNIDLTKMQLTISRSRLFYGHAGYCGYNGAGISSSKLVDKLEECKNVTYIATNGMANASDGELDLTNTKLTGGYFQGGGKFIIPSCLHSLRSWYVDETLIDFRNFKNNADKSFSLENGSIGKMGNQTEDNQKWQLQQFIDNGIDFKSLSFDIRDGKYLSYDLLQYLSRINVLELKLGSIPSQENFNFVPSSWTGNLENITSLTMTGTTLKNLNFLRNNSKLENLSLVNCKIEDISGLQCYETLKNLDLSSNNITNLAGMSNFTHLGEKVGETEGILNLSSNPIYNTYNYMDENGGQMKNEDGSPKQTKNIEELSKLKENAKSLKKIILLPNNYIEDFGPLEKLGWNKNTGTFE